MLARRLFGDDNAGSRPVRGGVSGAVLRLAKLTDAEYVLDQVAAGVEDYYLGSGEAPGVWTGPAGRPAGPGRGGPGRRSAIVDRRRHPGSGERLAGSKPATVRAIDATFSAPKSVSLLWAFGPPEAATAVSIAHVEAVQAALGFVEGRRRSPAGR